MHYSLLYNTQRKMQQKYKLKQTKNRKSKENWLIG